MARQAKALDVLLDEVNHFAPRRSRVSDGGLGDPAHASRVSDHNPNSKGVWRARDFTNDINGRPPRGGDDLPGQYLANLLVKEYHKDNPHPAMRSGAYTIFNRRIYSYDRREEGWRPYDGTNAHKTHVHQSVATAESGYDSTKPWNLFDRAPNSVERMRSHIIEAIADGNEARKDREVVHNQTAVLRRVLDVLPMH